MAASSLPGIATGAIPFRCFPVPNSGDDVRADITLHTPHLLCPQVTEFVTPIRAFCIPFARILGDCLCGMVVHETSMRTSVNVPSEKVLL
jgi:hypothetical protein